MLLSAVDPISVDVSVSRNSAVDSAFRRRKNMGKVLSEFTGRSHVVVKGNAVSSKTVKVDTDYTDQDYESMLSYGNEKDAERIEGNN